MSVVLGSWNAGAVRFVSLANLPGLAWRARGIFEQIAQNPQLLHLIIQPCCKKEIINTGTSDRMSETSSDHDELEKEPNRQQQHLLTRKYDDEAAVRGQSTTQT